jgi:hypothetical protein
MSNDALPCIRCDKRLLNVDPDYSENQPNDGLAFLSRGHYGTTLFDPMDGSIIVINVCDVCLRKAARKEQVLWNRSQKPIHCIDHPDMQLGLFLTDTPYLPWDPEVDYEDLEARDKLFLDHEDIGKVNLNYLWRYTKCEGLE